jgi:hypothetical protein
MQFDIEKMVPPPLVDSVCVECGAHVPATFHTCDAFCLSVLAEGRAKFGLVPPRLAIDAFALQHPKRACKSAKSYAGHLMGLCCGQEYAGSPRVHHIIQQWLSTSAERRGVVRPQDIANRGTLTIQHLSAAKDAADFDTRVREWGGSVWNAYASQHEIARAWVSAALTGASQTGASHT